jgi:hypothetical protein
MPEIAAHSLGHIDVQLCHVKIYVLNMNKVNGNIQDNSPLTYEDLGTKRIFCSSKWQIYADWSLIHF